MDINIKKFTIYFLKVSNILSESNILLQAVIFIFLLIKIYETLITNH